MNLPATLLQIVLFAPPIILAITVHEMGHGWVARRLGDPTASRLGRLSPNPLRHIDPIGSILIPALLLITSAPFLFGWARPVPVNWRNLRRPRRDIALVALAGPAANALMLLGWIGAIWTGHFLGAWSVFLGRALISMGEVGIISNGALIAFNLLPLPPLDGGRVVTAMLPLELARKYSRLEPYGLIIIMILLATGLLNDIVGPLLAAGDWLVRGLLPA